VDRLQALLDQNALWAAGKVDADPDFFRRLVGQQAPKHLWIGCSDSRVPANEIVAMQPGELFVHRNVANVVPLDDINCQSVIEFAVDVLKVEHIMVVGHYGCSGIHTVCSGKHVGQQSSRWLQHVRDVMSLHRELIEAEPSEHRRESLLCELNVLEQTANTCSSTAVTGAWQRAQPLTIHGWIYRLGDGRLRHLDFSVDSEQDIGELRRRALTRIVAARRQYYAGKPGTKK
jgi:carbonic anhydrase